MLGAPDVLRNSVLGHALGQKCVSQQRINRPLPTACLDIEARNYRTFDELIIGLGIIEFSDIESRASWCRYRAEQASVAPMFLVIFPCSLQKIPCSASKNSLLFSVGNLSGSH